MNVVGLMEQVIARNNMAAALRRVEQNRGAPGIDGMHVKDLREVLQTQWPTIRQALLDGTYRPQPVRRVDIPKPSGGTRMLGIPTVTDRLIQQALRQVLAPIFEPGFSNHSYGFRPGRSAHQAIGAAREHVEAGCQWVVDLDLDAFFNRVNHDALMARVMRKVSDKRVRMLIRRYLQAGIMTDGVKVGTSVGTPQGGPLSPLLANILLDDLDKELERRGHRFVRYADDVTIYVRSERGGKRVMASVKRFLEKRLRLRVNDAKSAVDQPWRRTLLGYSMYFNREGVRLRCAPQSIDRLKGRLRQLTRRTWSISMAERIMRINRYLRGWLTYFARADMASFLRDIEGWLRRRLQACIWKQWKRPKTRLRALRALGHEDWKARQWSMSRRGIWAMAGVLNSALGKRYWQDQGLLQITAYYRNLRQA